MSHRKKNRSIASLPIATNEFHALKRCKSPFDRCLGEDVKYTSDTPNDPFATDTGSSDLEGIFDSELKISGLSSGSSLSWSEEYESEVGRKVQSELERLDIIFQTLKDPGPYDIDEIEEWKTHFPSLYILGHYTPTNSAENSDASPCTEDELLTTHKPRKLRNQSSYNARKSNWPFNPLRDSLPRKPRSLDIDQYLKISSFKSPRKNQSVIQPVLEKQKSIGTSQIGSPKYTSLPFLMTTPLKTQVRERKKEKSESKMLVLPPIDNNFRSVSATPRHASSKSMYVPLIYERSSSKKTETSLKHDLMKLFDSIPISNR